MKFALVLIHFQPITYHGVASSPRPHARQPFSITKDTALIATRRHILYNSARTILLMLVGASTPSLVSSGTTAPRTAAGMSACCATAAATKQVDPAPALARITATGHAGKTVRVSHTTPNSGKNSPDARSGFPQHGSDGGYGTNTNSSFITVHQSVSPASTNNAQNCALYNEQ